VVWKVDLSARAVFRGFPEIKYIEHHRAEKKGVEQLKLFEELVRDKWCERAKSTTRICWKPRRKRRGNSLYIANPK
jgi:hypothetical protein